MASRSGSYRGTTHVGGGRGPGGGRSQKGWARRFAWPDPRKQRSGGNASPWFLREFGARPASKLKPLPLADVA